MFYTCICNVSSLCIICITTSLYNMFVTHIGLLEKDHLLKPPASKTFWFWCVHIKAAASLTRPCLLPRALFPVIHNITTALLLTQQYIKGHVSTILSQSEPHLPVNVFRLVPWGSGKSQWVNSEMHRCVCVRLRSSQFNALLQIATTDKI